MLKRIVAPVGMLVMSVEAWVGGACGKSEIDKVLVVSNSRQVVPACPT